MVATSSLGQGKGFGGASKSKFHFNICNCFYINFQIRDRVGKFEKFIQENDAKRRRAIQKYQTELKLKEAKKSESDILATELNTLRSK